MIYQLQFIEKDVCDQIKNVNVNKQRYEAYLNEIKSITEYGKFYVPIEKLKQEKLLKTEKKLFDKNIQIPPIQFFSINVKLYRTDLNGQVFEVKKENFNEAAIYGFLKRLHSKRGTYYLDKGIWDAICRVERGKVSNKMRFAVYARDNNRCRRCGVSGKFATLEVDHIIPIAKGGKSTYDNLQTLCHNCNVEKGDSL